VPDAAPVASPEPVRSSPEDVYSFLSSFQSGVAKGRVDAHADTEADFDTDAGFDTEAGFDTDDDTEPTEGGR
jgi:hypothetical protein